jgi:hypothetical protein
MKRSRASVGLILLALSACGEADPAADAASHPVPGSGSGAVGAAAVSATVATLALPTVLVYKTEGCGCCNGWIEHLRAAGFTVDARDVTDLMAVKRDAGVPVANSSCHTALVDGYVVEGHVPADLVKKMLAERPDVVGLAVPGMPVGSPGMEGSGAKPFQVLTFDLQGKNTVYATVDPR